MKNNNLRIEISLFLILMITLATNMFQGSAQIKNDGKNGTLIKSARKVVKKDGWILPNATYKPENSRSLLELEGVTVERKMLSPDENLTTFEEHYILSNEEILVTTWVCRVGTMAAFEVDGKRFAYQVLFNPVGVGNGRQVNSAGVVAVYFFDNDGDGVFEERLRSTASPVVPSWVREQSKAFPSTE